MPDDAQPRLDAIETLKKVFAGKSIVIMPYAALKEHGIMALLSENLEENDNPKVGVMSSDRKTNEQLFLALQVFGLKATTRFNEHSTRGELGDYATSGDYHFVLNEHALLALQEAGIIERLLMSENEIGQAAQKSFADDIQAIRKETLGPPGASIYRQ